jgi:2-succinyl-5-enolpyruvyl-6-hydroxy-3-cyclohexene-1-carboxylate synthase
MDQVVFDTSEICYQHGVRHAVFSPGSRNAALSISFNRNEKIDTRVIVDERSAGFIALGIAQQTGRPVVLCCTSGTALLNYGPAIAEAYFQRIPLIILSADRPPEWIDQWDGQTIRQGNVLANHVVAFEQMPVDRTHADAQWEYRRKLSMGILRAQEGPVHLNIPFREPFYPSPFEDWQFSKINPIKIHKEGITHHFEAQLINEWSQASKKLIILGQGIPGQATLSLLHEIATEQHVPVINEVTGNGHALPEVISHQDLFLMNAEVGTDLSPDLVLTIGLSTLSKNLKKLIRSSSAVHWHLDESKQFPGDTFQQLSNIIQAKPETFLTNLLNAKAQDIGFKEKWLKANRHAEMSLESLSGMKYSEFVTFKRILESLPPEGILHLSNSMPVRYANFLGIRHPHLTIYCNRGTSGIDGTNSTAVGHAMSSEKQVILLTGDLSFLYDRNAFFHEYDISNLRIVVFNNFGGGIFDLIPGPSKLDENEKEKHFTTPHHKEMKHSALDAGMLYYKANDEITLELALNEFFERSDRPKLLEIQTASKVNQEVYQTIKNSI